MERRLAAVMFSDIVGYTARMAESEEQGLRLRRRHRGVLSALAAGYRGEIVDENGDELVLAFPSASDAVNCALAAQEELRGDEELHLRIGIHLGDVVFDAGRVYGDGVNLASRIRPLAEPGGICISDEVQHSIQNQPNVETRPLGEQELKNVPRPVPVFAVSGTARPPQRSPAGGVKPLRRMALRVGLVLAALVVVSAAVWLSTRRTPDAGPIRSIAVLPFADMSAGQDQEYFADGMTDALIVEFAKVASLKVISRTSVLQYKGTLKTAPEIARELGVDGLIEGSVVRDADRIRITAQLIHGPTDRHLWAESYTNTLTNVLRLHSEVALAISGAVGVVLTPEESARMGDPGTVDPQAYEAFLLGTHLRDEGTRDGILSAIRHFERATALDPDFALAWAGMSKAYSSLGAWGFEKPRRAYARAETAARRALALDPSLGRAYEALGWLAHGYEWEWGEAERLYRKALELAPGDAQAHAELSWLLLQTGRYAEAVAEAEITLDLDPRSRLVRNDVALLLDFTDADRERARQLREDLYREDPTFVPLLNELVVQRFRDGTPDEAILAAEELVRAAPPDARPQLILALTHAMAGDGERARQIVAAARRTYGEERLSNAQLGGIHMALGEFEQGVEAYERAFQEREWWMVWLRVAPYGGGADTSPVWARVRRDPRYWELMRRMNFPPFPPDHPGYAEEQAQLQMRDQ